MQKLRERRRIKLDGEPQINCIIDQGQVKKKYHQTNFMDLKTNICIQKYNLYFDLTMFLASNTFLFCPFCFQVTCIGSFSVLFVAFHNNYVLIL